MVLDSSVIVPGQDSAVRMVLGGLKAPGPFPPACKKLGVGFSVWYSAGAGILSWGVYDGCI